MAYPNSTLLGINAILTQSDFRRKVLSKVDDPVLLKFWHDEYETLSQKQQLEISSSILNKVGQFLSNPIIRNIIGQPKNSFSMRWIMDNNKIFVVNLSK